MTSCLVPGCKNTVHPHDLQCNQHTLDQVHPGDVFFVKKRLEMCESKVRRLVSENTVLIKAIEHMMSMCGNPDAVDACRLIMNRGKQALEESKGDLPTL